MPPDNTLAITCAGQTIWLLPSRSLFWPARRTLVVADTHIGKEATFQAQGISLPNGQTQTDLARLSAVLEDTRAQRLIVAGDFLHAEDGLSPAIRSAVRRWSERHRSIEKIVIRGNHDRGIDLDELVPEAQLLDEPLTDAPFTFQHYPDKPSDQFVIAGHLHPGLRFELRGRDRLRLPCFWVREERLVLPAFSTFTGLADVDALVGRHALVADGQVLWAPATSPG